MCEVHCKNSGNDTFHRHFLGAAYQASVDCKYYVPDCCSGRDRRIKPNRMTKVGGCQCPFVRNMRNIARMTIG